MSSIIFSFFDDLWEFMFAPSSAAKVTDGRPGSVMTHFYIFYISLLLGVSMWFFLFYPEPLYYHTSGALLKKEVPSILLANPWHSLAVVTGALLVIVFFFIYLIQGCINYLLLKKSSAKNRISLSAYLGIYGYSLTPLLLLVPLIAFRIFFFERWINLRPLYPFFDFTIPSIIHLLLTAGLLAWKMLIEIKINRKIFQASLVRTMIPASIQAGAWILAITLPLFFNERIFNALKDGLV